MKKGLFVSLFLFFIFTISAIAQVMTDQQIISYIKEQHKQGVSQQQIAQDLVKRGVTPAQLQRLKNKYDTTEQTASEKRSETVVLRDNNPIENIPMDEIGEEISDFSEQKVFGKNIFNTRNLTFEPDSNIPTPANYILGPGDEVIIEVWGVSETYLKQQISPEGNIYVQNLGPIYLAGMTVEQANAYIQNRFGNVFAGVDDHRSHIKLTLGQIRTISINVMGEVSVPGTYSVSSLATIFHALYRAGGMNDIGSLRTVRLFRSGKLVITIDIYKYIIDGNTKDDVRLQDGDVIIVPPYSRLVDIIGKVKRPMFYELLPGETVTNLIDYAGGFANGAYTENVKITRQTGDRNRIYTVNRYDYNSFELTDGDIVTISPGLEEFDNRVEIKGAVYREGYYELGSDIATLKELIEVSGGLVGDAFMNRAVLIREKEDLSTITIPVDLNRLMSGDSSADIILMKNDIVYIPSIGDISEDKNVVIHGEIPRPGAYKYSANTTLEDLIVQAGGLLESASVVRIDVARRITDPYSISVSRDLAETYTFGIKDGLIIDGDPEFVLEPYDHVYVRRSPGYHIQQNVHLEGEVTFPGAYALNKKSERISDIVKRAGWLTPDAYAIGARLIRQRSEEEKFRSEKALGLATHAGKDSISVSDLDLASSYSVGIELNKALTDPGSDYDLVLRPGDRLFIPEYENTVKINGAVMYPNTVLFKRGEKASYYINQAGGYNEKAKKNKAYVIYMNGTVSKIRGRDKNAIQPGCEIIVPSKEPSNKLSLPEIVSVTASVTSMASVVALLINAIAN